MKIFLRLIVFAVAVSIVYFGYRVIPLSVVQERFADSKVYVERNGTQFFSDWTDQTVLSKINNARSENGLDELKINEKLSQAARSRLSVILTDNDYDGAITGVTREASVENSGYNASTIGDLLLIDYFKTNDPITEWLSDPTTKDTLLLSKFKEVGIAIKNDVERVNVYVVFVSPTQPQPRATTVAPKVTWGGPDLWSAVNIRRVERGVNPLSQKSELCTIASIRLNQLIELGKLDGHAGFVPVLDREDLKWISEKYNVSEFLAHGYTTPLETINAWENTLGHKALLTGGEYVWGCVYAQNTFAVAIAAY